MRYRHLALTLALATMAPPALLDAQARRAYTAETALDVRNVRIAAVSDDGRRVAATVQTRRDRADVDHQRFGDPTYISPVSTRLLVIDTQTGAERWVHEEPQRLRGYTWSPDGDRLAYSMATEAGPELRVYDADAGTDRSVAIRSPLDLSWSSPIVWTPDGAQLLVGLRPEGWAEDARDAFYSLTEAPVIVQDSRNDFLAWDRVRAHSNRHVMALLSVDDGAVRRIDIDETPVAPAFSEDGRYLVYQTARRTATSYTRRDGTEYGLFRLDLGDGSVDTIIEESEERVRILLDDAAEAYAYSEEGSVYVRQLSEEEPRLLVEGSGAEEEEDDDEEEEEGTRYTVSRWSPDGAHLLVTTSDGWHVVEIDSGEIRPVLTLEEDEDARPSRSPVAWTDDGTSIFFSQSATDRWERGLRRLDVASGEVETVVLDDALYRSWNVSDDGTTIVYSMSDGDRPDDLWVRRAGAATRLTEANPQLADVELTRSELVEYLDVDGNTLYGILYYPHGYEPGRTYPLVAEIYERFFDNGYNENMNLITSQGWFGFRPSVQFEEGYPGEAWLKAVPSAINEVLSRGMVDEEKLGVYGQSYGGYATNLLITQTDRFAAAANVSGKVNMISFLGDSPKITTRNYGAAEVGQDRIGATLWEQPHKYIEHSAVMFADRIDTPLLMLSGEGDWNVPATNQREMYYALRRLGKEVVWVHYTAGGHGAGRASSEADFVDHWQRMVDWFAEHFGEADEAVSISDGGR